MTTLDRVRRLTVNATSPKRHVVATARGDGDITVRFARSAVADHDESVLAAELAAAVRGAFTGYRRGMADVLGGDPMAAEHPRVPPGHPAAKRRRLLAEAVGRLSVQSTSPARVVQLRWRGVDGIEFRLRPGCLAEPRTTREFLTREVDAVIASTLAKRRRGGHDLFDAINRTAKEH